jgi:hypothetical protein
MFETLNALIAAFGLAFAAGLNAYIPLFMIGAAARFFPGDWLVLAPPFRFLSEDWCLILLGGLLLIEILADKIPIVDHMNDLLGTLVRPVAGAILFAAGTGTVEHLDPRVAMALGFVSAGAVHGLKMAFRPFVSVTTGGAGNPVVSFIEDVVSFFMTLFALLLPVLVLVGLIGIPILVIRWMSRRKRRSAGLPVPPPGVG